VCLVCFIGIYSMMKVETPVSVTEDILKLKSKLDPSLLREKGMNEEQIQTLMKTFEEEMEKGVSEGKAGNMARLWLWMAKIPQYPVPSIFWFGMVFMLCAISWMFIIERRAHVVKVVPIFRTKNREAYNDDTRSACTFESVVNIPIHLS